MPDCVGLEGPYGEYPGYRTGEMGNGVPVIDVYVPPEGAVHTAVISVELGGKEPARKILEILTSRRALLSKSLW